MTVRVVEIGPRMGLSDWLAVPHRVHIDDPAYVSLPDSYERKRVSVKHAPFGSFGEFALFVAYRGGEPIGRISAQVNHRHLERHKDGTGHFGFFCCQNDQQAADALVTAAAEWLSKKKGLSRMLGPTSFSLNDECGCLVAGFDTPPAVLMPHARPYTAHLLERAGLEKVIDLFAYRACPSEMLAYVKRIKSVRRPAKVHLRPFDRRRFEAEIELVAAIYSDAWQDNWGFVPFAPAEIAAFVKDMPLLLRNSCARFAYIDGEPIGVTIVLANINDLLTRYRGRSSLFNLLRQLWTIRFTRTRTARIPLLGICRKYQSTPIGSLSLALMLVDIYSEIDRDSTEWIEFSWILETNQQMKAIAEKASGDQPAKTYRLYSKQIEPAR